MNIHCWNAWKSFLYKSKCSELAQKYARKYDIIAKKYDLCGRVEKMCIIKSIQAFIHYSTINYWTDIYFWWYKSSKLHWNSLESIASNFILFSNAEVILWFVRIYILPSFHLIMIEMPELDMPHYEPNNNTGIEKWTTLWHWNTFVLWTTYFEEEEYECWTLLIIFIVK